MTSFLGYLVVLSMGQASAGAPKPPSLIPALREVDQAVDRMQLPVNAYIPGADRRALDAAIETIMSMPVAAVPHWVNLAPQTVVPTADGLELTGTVAPQRAKRVFYNDAEANLIDDFAFQRRKLKEDHWRCLEGIKGADANNSEEFVYRRALDELAQKEAKALQPGEENSKARAVAYNTIKVIAVAAPEVARSIDFAKLAKAKSVKTTIQINGVELSAPIAEAKIPSLLSVVRGQLVDVDASVKGGAQSGQDP